MNANASEFQSAQAFQIFSLRRLSGLPFAAALAVAALSGCAAELAATDEESAEVDATGEALVRGGGGGSLGFSCTNGVCTCDKSIENDCEDMSGVCSDGSIDDLISCIDGWATTHCVCTQIRTSSPAGTVYTPPTGGVAWTAAPVASKPVLTLAK